MSNNVADTSKVHYMDLVEKGVVGDQCQKVIEVLEKLDGDPTINELGHTIELGDMANSTISGRLGDLKDLGIVKDLRGDAKRKDRFSGITCKVWTLVDNHKEKEPSEWVSSTKGLELESTEGLFEDSEQSEVLDSNEQKTGKVLDGSERLEPGDLIWG